MRTGEPVKPLRILIVDDNEDMRAFMRIALERAGYTADVAADARNAIALQQEHPADVLITDIFMPDSDGLELIGLFKTSFPQVKIIAMSGGGQIAKGDYLPVAAECGAVMVLKKPFSSQILLKILQDLAS